MAKSKAIRMGIVGCGRAGINMHCNELKGRERKFKIVAAADALKERRDYMEENYGCRTYKTIDELLKDEEVELVDIATKSTDHLDDVLKALKTGKDVFLEKPICTTYEEAKKIRSAAKRAKGTLYIRHNRRFEPAFQHILEIIESGKLGDVHEIKLRRVQFQRRDDWQTLKRYGGGQLLNWGPHIIDHGLRYLQSPLKDVTGWLRNVVAAGNAEDHLKIVMEGKNGRLVDIEISGGSAVNEPVYVVTGNRGGLICEDEKTIKLKYLNPRKKLTERNAKASAPDIFGGFGSPDELDWVEQEIPVKPKKKVQMDKIWDYMYDSIRKGKEFPIKIDEAVEVMKVVDKVKEGTRFAKKKKTKRAKRSKK